VRSKKIPLLTVHGSLFVLSYEHHRYVVRSSLCIWPKKRAVDGYIKWVEGETQKSTPHCSFDADIEWQVPSTLNCFLPLSLNAKLSTLNGFNIDCRVASLLAVTG